MTYTLGKVTLGAVAIAAALTIGGMVSTPAAAAPDKAANAPNGLQSSQAASDTDMSSHRRHVRRYRHVRHWRVYPYRYGYVRPYRYRYVRPYRYAYPYPYAYYRPRPYYYRSYYGPGPFFHGPGPFFSIGFGVGPRYYW